MRILKYCLLLACMAVMSATGAEARRFAVSTNLAGYANLGTLNAELAYSFARRWTVNAGVKYNPWTFISSGRQFQNRQQSYSAGARFWPWHVYSGW